MVFPKREKGKRSDEKPHRGGWSVAAASLPEISK